MTPHPFTLRTARLLGGALILLGAGACVSKRVTRIEPTAVTDLSGRWNDTDSRLVANQIIEQTLSSGWAKRYADTHGGEAPAVVIGTFANNTAEHIAVGTFVKDVERALIGTGSARVVASGDQRVELRGERKDQQQYARADTRAKQGQELGARYVLAGELEAIEDVDGRERVVFYQVDASLIDLETNAKVWVGQHKIKKYVERARYVLAGELEAIEDVDGRERVVFYQVDASLIDLETNAKVWVGQHKIKKYVERARFGR